MKKKGIEKHTPQPYKTKAAERLRRKIQNP